MAQASGHYNRFDGTDANAKVWVNHGLGVVPSAILVTDRIGTVAAPRVYSVGDESATRFSVKVAIVPDNNGDYHYKPNGGSHPDFYWLAIS